MHARGARGTLQVHSAAAEAVKVYEKEYNIGRRHKMKVSQLSTVFCGAGCKRTVWVSAYVVGRMDEQVAKHSRLFCARVVQPAVIT